MAHIDVSVTSVDWQAQAALNTDALAHKQLVVPSWLTSRHRALCQILGPPVSLCAGVHKMLMLLCMLHAGPGRDAVDSGHNSAYLWAGDEARPEGQAGPSRLCNACYPSHLPPGTPPAVTCLFHASSQLTWVQLVFALLVSRVFSTSPGGHCTLALLDLCVCSSGSLAWPCLIHLDSLSFTEAALSISMLGVCASLPSSPLRTPNPTWLAAFCYPVSLTCAVPLPIMLPICPCCLCSMPATQ